MLAWHATVVGLCANFDCHTAKHVRMFTFGCPFLRNKMMPWGVFVHSMHKISNNLLTDIWDLYLRQRWHIGQAAIFRVRPLLGWIGKKQFSGSNCETTHFTGEMLRKMYSLYYNRVLSLWEEGLFGPVCVTWLIITFFDQSASKPGAVPGVAWSWHHRECEVGREFKVWRHFRC